MPSAQSIVTIGPGVPTFRQVILRISVCLIAVVTLLCINVSATNAPPVFISYYVSSGLPIAGIGKFWQDDIHITNPYTSSTTVSITIGGYTYDTVTVPAQTDVYVSFPTPTYSINAGPVEIASQSSTAVVASERVLFSDLANGSYPDSFSEVNALPLGNSSTSLVLNWYDHDGLTFTSDLIYIVNTSSTSTGVTVTLPGVTTQNVTVPADGVASLDLGQGVVGGPVFITAGSPVQAFRRTVYGSTFNDVNAVPASAASTSLMLDWYDQDNMSFKADNVHLANPNSTATTATVTVGTNTKMVTVPARGYAFVSFSGVVGGPVFITSGLPILASKRTTYDVSFCEVNAVPTSAAAKNFVLLWYDQDNISFKADTVHLANPSSTATTATVKVGTHTQTLTVPAKGAAYVGFPGVVAGPVFINAAAPINASRRTIYNYSFHEVNAIPY
jgi:hypothetical protein